MYDNMGDHTTVVCLLNITKKQEPIRRRPYKELLFDIVSGTETRSVLLGVYKYNKKDIDYQFKHDLIYIVVGIQDFTWYYITTCDSSNTIKKKPLQDKSQQ